MSETPSPLVETIPRRRKADSATRGASQRSSASSCGSKRSSQARRRRIVTADVASSGLANQCAPHTPLLSTVSRPTPTALEPLPNTRTLCACVVDDTLVTAHRNGVRLYRPAANASQQGVWHLIETRDTFDLRESYLCVSAQPLVTRRRGLYRSKYARYFCVASGSDRSIHSLSVLSTRAHFSIQHTEHERHRICAAHLSQVAVQPFREDAPVALAVSADEVGGICLLDVEQERPFVVMQASRPAPHAMTAPALTDWIRASVRAEDQPAPYRFSDGLITKIALVGPCLELCPGCHNACSPPDDELAASSGVRRPSVLLLSVVITSRGPDVSPEEPTSAQLHTAMLRVVWTDQGAFALTQTRVVDAVAPVRVCEMGRALSVPSYQTNKPMRVLVGGPRLSIEVRRACTGEVLHVYANPSLGTMRGEGEYFVQFVHLGTRRVTAGSGASSSSPQKGTTATLETWQCVLALTSESSLLLLGLKEEAEEVTSIEIAPSKNANASITSQPGTSPPPDDATSRTPALPLDGPEKLNDWLDDIELVAESPPVANLRTATVDSPAAEVPAALQAAPYTTLAELFNPRQGPWSQTVNSFSVDWKQNSAVIFLADQETMLSVSLPLSLALALDDDSGAATTATKESVQPATSPADNTISGGGGGGGAAYGFASSIWESTSKGLSAAAHATTSTSGKWAASTRWTTSALSRWRGGSEENPNTGPSTAAARDSSNDGARAASAPSASAVPVPPQPHTYSIVRPLAVALATLTGGIASSSSSDAPMPVLVGDRRVDQDSADLSAAETAQPPPAADPVDTEVTERLDSQHPSSSSPPPPPVTDQLVALSPVRHSRTHHPRHGHEDDGENEADDTAPLSRTKHSRRRPRVKKSVGASSNGHSGTSASSSHATTLSRADMDAYMNTQMQRAQEDVSTGRSPVSANDDIPSPEAVQPLHGEYAVQQLIDIDEPLARNALFYEWRDGHDALFIQQSAAREQLDTDVKHAAVLAAYRATEIADLYGRRPLADVADGKHSMQFLSAVEAILSRRERTRDRRGCFGFEAYFASCEVPQHLLDLQEQDKCRFELRDLEQQQAQEVGKLSPESDVEILQNEEKREQPGGKGRTRWESHATFPYDDKDGQTVDLARLNQQADMKRVREWRWKTAQDERVVTFPIAAPENGAVVGEVAATAASSPRRAPQVVAKDLKGWSVGPWQYANHWPNTAQEREDPDFWSTKDGPQCTVRCRVLRRTRVHIATDNKRKQLMLEHAKQLESLRTDLGL